MPRGQDKVKKNSGKRPKSTPVMPVGSHVPSMDAGCLIHNTMKMQDWISKKQVQDIQVWRCFLFYMV